MALTIPSVEDMAAFQMQESVDDEAAAYMRLQMAADLLSLATGLEDDPTDPRLARVLKWGIMDMAWWLLVQADNRDELFSPHQSERIGSYSYSKASQSVRSGADTGVFFFDQAVAALKTDVFGSITITGEQVFEPTFSSYEKAYSEPGFWQNRHDPA